MHKPLQQQQSLEYWNHDNQVIACSMGIIYNIYLWWSNLELSLCPHSQLWCSSLCSLKPILFLSCLIQPWLRRNQWFQSWPPKIVNIGDGPYCWYASLQLWILPIFMLITSLSLWILLTLVLISAAWIVWKKKIDFNITLSFGVFLLKWPKAEFYSDAALNLRHVIIVSGNG